MRYDLIGQDRALEQLFSVLSMPTNALIVVLMCGKANEQPTVCVSNECLGPSRHGKSLLARKCERS